MEEGAGFSVEEGEWGGASLGDLKERALGAFCGAGDGAAGEEVAGEEVAAVRGVVGYELGEGPVEVAQVGAA